MYNGTVATTTETYGATRIRVVQNSMNIANNTSNVTIYYEAQVKGMTSFPSNLIMDLRVGYQSNFGRDDYWNIPNIKDVSPATKITANNTWYTLYTISNVTCNHNAAGVCNLSVVMYFAAMDNAYHSAYPTSYGVAALENTYKATTATVTFNTSAKALNMGSAGTITLPRNSSNLTHRVVATFGSQTQTISTNAGASVSWTPAIATFAPQITNATTKSGTLTVTTYNGSTQVGSPTTTTFWLAVPTSVVPTATLTASDNKGYLSKYGGYVQGKSELKTVVAGSGAQGSTITGYSTSYDGTSKTTATSTFNTNTAGTRTISAIVTDSRGRTGTKTQNITVLAYAAPFVQVSADRCNEDGTPNAMGEYIKATAVPTYSTLNNKNTKTVKIRYKTSTSNTWGTWQEGEELVFPANADYAYDVMAQIADDFNTVNSSTVQVPGSFVLVDYGGMEGVEGTGLAFGGAATEANTFLNYLKYNKFYGELHRISSGTYRAGLFVHLLDVNDTEPPSSNMIKRLVEAYDADDTYINALEGAYYTNGEMGTQMVVGRKINNAQAYRRLIVSFAANGTSRTRMETDDAVLGRGDLTTNTTLFLQTKNYTSSIKAYDTGNAYGHALVISPGATFVAGGGEYAESRYGLGDITDTEDAYIGADYHVRIESNGNNIADRKTWDFNKSGILYPPRATGVDVSTAPSSRVSGNIFSFLDKNGNSYGQLQYDQRNTGAAGIMIGGRNGSAWNQIGLAVDASGKKYVYIDAPAEWRSALGFTTSTTAPTITAASNFTISGITARKQWGMVQILFSIVTTNALTANTNYTVGTVSTTAYRPVMEADLTPRAAGAALFRGYINTSGGIIIRPNQAVSANTTLFAWTIYIAASF